MLTDEPHSSQAADIPQLFNLNDVNDLVRDLGLTKGKLELISSKWKQWNILQKGVNCTYILPDTQIFKIFFLHRIMSVIASTLMAFLKH